MRLNTKPWRTTLLVAAFDAALVRLQADTTLSRGDRLDALFARVDLARLDQPKDTMHPKLPPALVKEVRDTAAATDREATNAFERQAVIPTAAQLLEEAGLWKRVGDAAQVQPGQEPLAVLPDERAGRQRAQAGPHGRGAAVVPAGLRQERGPGHAPAVGQRLPERAGRPGAAGCEAHRGRRAGRVRRGRRRSPTRSTSAAAARCSAWAPSSRSGTPAASTRPSSTTSPRSCRASAPSCPPATRSAPPARACFKPAPTKA